MLINKKALLTAAAAGLAAGALAGLAAIDATIQHEDNLGYAAGDESDDEDES